MLLELPTVHVSGDPVALGSAYGAACDELIRAFTAQRLRAAKVYLWAHGIRGLDRLLEAARDCQQQVADWDPDGLAEHRATAAAAGVDPDELFAATNMTDVRDVVLYADAESDREGCTSLLIPADRTADGELIAAQTWDLNPGDLDYIVAVHRRPDRGPATWSVTCAGCQSLVGMNEAGLWVGTTNLKTLGTRPGVPYLSLLHGMLATESVAAASQRLEDAPLAAAHSYWLADATGGCRYECSAKQRFRQDLQAPGLCQTNHCLAADHCIAEAEDPSASSLARRRRAEAFLRDRSDHDATGVKELFADRSDGVDSINRYPEDDQGTATNSCLIGIPARRELHACKGPADRGRWQTLAW